MVRFTYRAVEPGGRSVSGEIDAADDMAALDQLVRQGLHPTEIRWGGGQAGPWWTREVQLFGPSVPLAQVAVALAALAMLLEAAVPLPQALTIARRQTRNRTLAVALDRAIAAVADGNPLAQALKAENGVFPDRVVVLIATGERSNTLPKAVAAAAQMLEDELTIRGELRSTLIYPVILIFMAVAVMGLVLFQLVPTLLPVFASAGQELPPSLAMLDGIRLLVSGHGLVLTVAVSLCLGVIVAVVRLNPARTDRLRLALPIVGPWLVDRETLRLARVLAAMLESGATVTEALRAAENAMPLTPYRSLVSSARERIEGGGSLSEGLGDSPLMHPLVGAMLPIGEQGDALGRILDQAAAALAVITRRRTALALKLVTPVLTLVIGLLVGGMILATITAVLDLNELAL